jgi:glyoxylase I family protein
MTCIEQGLIQGGNAASCVLRNASRAVFRAGQALPRLRDSPIIPWLHAIDGYNMIRGIHHVAVHVRDLDRMLEFYSNAFGFEIVGEKFSWGDNVTLDRILDVPGSAARGAMLRAGTCYLEMFQFSAPEPVSTRPLRPFDKGYTHFCVDVTDIEKEYIRLQALGMTFGHPAPIDMGHVKTVYGRDPEGNVIEIQQTAQDCEFRIDGLPPRQ